MMGGIKNLVIEIDDAYLLGKKTPQVPSGMGLRKALRKLEINPKIISILDAGEKTPEQTDNSEEEYIPYCGCGCGMRLNECGRSQESY